MTLLTPERLAELEHYARLRTAPAPQDAEAIRALLAHIDALTARLAGLTKPVDDDIEETQYWRVVYRHAVRLLEALHPGLLKANTTIGIINQIDNITVGLARENAALKVERDAADAKEDDATHRAHNAEANLAEAVAALASARSDALEEAAITKGVQP